MVNWVIDEANIVDRTFRNHRQEVMGSFSVDKLQLTYRFFEKSAKENEDPLDVTQTWKSSEGKLK